MSTGLKNLIQRQLAEVGTGDRLRCRYDPQWIFQRGDTVMGGLKAGSGVCFVAKELAQLTGRTLKEITEEMQLMVG